MQTIYLRKDYNMKKIISLVLVVIMLFSLAVSSSAITILGSDKYTGNTTTLKDLLYYLYIYGDCCDKPSYDCGNVSGYDWWYGKCPTCLSDAFYYRAENITYWSCLSTSCGEQGSNSPVIDHWWAGVCGYCGGSAFYYTNGNKTYWRCVEDDCGKHSFYEPDSSTPGITLSNRCNYCTSRDISFVAAFIKDGSVYYEYYCKNCNRTSIKLVGNGDLDINPGVSAQSTPCSTLGCGKTAYYDRYVVGQNSLSLVFKCSEGHETTRLLGQHYWGNLNPTGTYLVTVVTNYGGSYTLSSGRYAEYNDLRTVTITPKYGYVIEDVEVNGKSFGATSKVTFRVRSNTVVRVTFAKAQPSSEKYIITTTSTGNGTVTAKKNFVSVSPYKVGAGYTDKVTYYFTPAAGYEIASVKVDGKSIGKVSSYTFSKVGADHKLEVTFAWKTTYKDVSSNYAAAVEYVTKNGIMTYSGNKNTFNGTLKVTVQDFALALAEMYDTYDILDNDVDRLKWAIKHDLVGAKENIDVTCSVQRACQMVDTYLEVIENYREIDFELFDSKASVKDNAIKIKMVNANIFEKNRDLTRYDLAAVCRLISTLEYEG